MLITYWKFNSLSESLSNEVSTVLIAPFTQKILQAPLTLGPKKMSKTSNIMGLRHLKSINMLQRLHFVFIIFDIFFHKVFLTSIMVKFS